MLDVTDLTISFVTRSGTFTPIRNFGLSLGHGEILGLAGPSGCGKTVFASSLLGLLDPPGLIAGGQALFTNAAGEDIDLYRLNESEFCNLRGREISMVFQDPVAALNPTRKISAIFRDTIKVYFPEISVKEIAEKTEKALAEVRLSDPPGIMNSYVHELSGGMCQRVMIALALLCRPSLLIADEPTTALDTVNQNAVLDLFHELRDKFGTSILLISHDMEVLISIADSVVRMPSPKA